ncbi:ABC transporter ATP-binding protein [Aeromicrobium sp. CTD01-1L150]|uniref:ABC transporter ATP-binding protein n=1 Tax=Aeromicrobium sp. CTD01-1L150 TaxID=3341830 RepID=UPI0035C0CDE6
MTEPVIELHDVSLTFGGVTALRNVDLDLREGELLALIGPNGAGKTSIFNVISGVYRPDSGAVRHRGQDLRRTRPPARTELGIARTFQNLELFPLLTVVENILTGRHRHLRSGFITGGLWFGRARTEEAEARLRAEEIIEFLDLEAYRHDPVSSLPYGIQKRVELGRALASDPQVLLLDEPVAGMNSEETEDLGRLILDIKEELDVSLLLVEHDLRVVMDLADRVAVLNFGQMLAIDTPESVQENDAVIEAYLGPALRDRVDHV